MNIHMWNKLNVEEYVGVTGAGGRNGEEGGRGAGQGDDSTIQDDQQEEDQDLFDGGQSNDSRISGRSLEAETYTG